jgi:hypothetical protein
MHGCGDKAREKAYSDFRNANDPNRQPKKSPEQQKVLQDNMKKKVFFAEFWYPFVSLIVGRTNSQSNEKAARERESKRTEEMICRSFRSKLF